MIKYLLLLASFIFTLCGCINKLTPALSLYTLLFVWGGVFAAMFLYCSLLEKTKK